MVATCCAPETIIHRHIPRNRTRKPQSTATVIILTEHIISDRNVRYMRTLQMRMMASVVNRWARGPGTAMAMAMELCRNAQAQGNAVYQKNRAAPTLMARYRSSGSGGEGGGGGRRRRTTRRGGRRRGGGKTHIIEVELDVDAEAQWKMAKRVEEVVRRAMVERAAPDWLPFLPGSSYWVPPPPPRLAHSIQIAISNPLSLLVTSDSASDPHAQLLSFATSPRGWPSSAYFLREGPSNNAETASEKADKSEEEES